MSVRAGFPLAETPGPPLQRQAKRSVDRSIPTYLALVVELADTAASKAAASRHLGSTPSEGTCSLYRLPVFRLSQQARF